MTTTDSAEQVYAWYHDQLISRGWQKYPLNLGVAGTQSSAQDYTKNDPNWWKARETFDVAIDKPKMLSEQLGKQVPATTTVFEFRYMIK